MTYPFVSVSHTIAGKLVGFAAGVIAKPLLPAVIVAGIGIATINGLRNHEIQPFNRDRGAPHHMAVPAQVDLGAPRSGREPVRLRHPLSGQTWSAGEGFGMRHHPLLNSLRMHTGVDWNAPAGTPISAAEAGVIESAGYDGQHGNRIVLRHSSTIKTTYSHLRGFPLGLRAGAEIARGETIGFVGSTGLSVGPHLHFELWLDDRPVDPLALDIWQKAPNEMLP